MDDRATTIIQDSLQTICKNNEKSHVANILDVYRQKEIDIKEKSRSSDSSGGHRETPHVTEFTQQLHCDDENCEQLEKDLEVIGKKIFFAKKNYNNHKQMIDQILDWIRQLVKKVQVQKELKHAKQVYRLKKTLKKEKARNKKEQTRLIEKLDILTKEKEFYYKKAIRQYKIRKKLKLLLEKEYDSVKNFKNLISQAEQERDSANAQLADMKQSQQELLIQLQREIEIGQEATKKREKAEIELDVMTQQYNSTKLQLENEIVNLYAQIEYQIENSDSINKLLLEENKELVSKIEDGKNQIKSKESLVKKLKNQGEVLQKERADLKQKISEQDKNYRLRENKLIKAIESKSEEIDLLRSKCSELSNVQSEIKRLKSADSNEEVLELQEKLVQADDKIKLYNRLKRERDVQEVAIEMLSADLDAITEEKEVLAQERDGLREEVSLLKEQCPDDPGDGETSYKEAGLSLKMLQL
jgi:chromosome segregation ATPase